MSFVSIRNPAKDLGRILITIGLFSIACVGDMFYNPLRKPNKSNVQLTSPPVLSRYHYEFTGGPPVSYSPELERRMRRARDALADEKIWLMPSYSEHNGAKSLVKITFASQDPSKVGVQAAEQARDIKLAWIKYIINGEETPSQSRASR